MNCSSECKYTRPEDNIIERSLMGFDLVFVNYCNTVDYLANAYYERKDIQDIIIRLDQREYYNYIFHCMPNGMNEIKKTALFCYWILKYRPFVVEFRDKTETEKNDEKAKSAYEKAYLYFSERFCLHFLNCVNWSFCNKDINISDINKDELEYALRHTDISKEAMTIIFELLTDVKATIDADVI